MSSQNKLGSTISAILITRDESRHLAKCLETLKFCNEVIVVDHGSSDDTVAIARHMGARVIQTTDWPGFGPQKQRALSEARSVWILSIDADERVTPQLTAEILLAIKQSHADGYFIKRRSQFLGRWMRFGGWYPDYVLRLAKRELACFDQALVHERLLVNGRIEHLKQHFLHYSYYDISDVLRKQRTYALLSGQRIRQYRGAHINVMLTLLRALWTFNRLYLLQLGFLDGRQGLISAIFKSQEVFWKYVAAEFDATYSQDK
jgi:glycosyltransferase involved in cell wall biosynthesis